MIQVEDAYLGSIEEEEEEEGEEQESVEDFHRLFGDMDIPDFTLHFDMEEDSDEDDVPHITVDQVHAAESADGGQDGAEGEPPEGTAGRVVPAASSDHKSSDHTTHEEL